MIAQAERSDIRKLLSYPEDSAGSIMTTEYASLPEEITVREALDRLRSQAPDRETIYYVYILDEDRRLHGFTSLRDLILAKPDAILADVMQRGVISVRVDDDQEFVAQEMARYDFLAIPVIDNQNHLVGIITYDDILDIVQEEATEDAHLLREVIGVLLEYPGTDRVNLEIHTGGGRVVMELPVVSTGYCEELCQRLGTLLGPDRVRLLGGIADDAPVPQSEPLL